MFSFTIFKHTYLSFWWSEIRLYEQKKIVLLGIRATPHPPYVSTLIFLLLLLTKVVFICALIYLSVCLVVQGPQESKPFQAKILCQGCLKKSIFSTLTTNIILFNRWKKNSMVELISGTAFVVGPLQNYLLHFLAVKKVIRLE